MATRKFISKETNINPGTYIGAKGELWVSDEDGVLRLGNGTSAGGTDITSGGGSGSEISNTGAFVSVENDGNIHIATADNTITWKFTNDSELLNVGLDGVIKAEVRDLKLIANERITIESGQSEDVRLYAGRGDREGDISSGGSIIMITGDAGQYPYGESGPANQGGDLMFYTGSGTGNQIDGQGGGEIFFTLGGDVNANQGNLTIYTKNDPFIFQGNTSVLSLPGALQFKARTTFELAGGAVPGQLGHVVAVSNQGGMLAYYNTVDEEWKYVHDNSAVV